MNKRGEEDGFKGRGGRVRRGPWPWRWLWDSVADWWPQQPSGPSAETGGAARTPVRIRGRVGTRSPPLTSRAREPARRDDEGCERRRSRSPAPRHCIPALAVRGVTIRARRHVVAGTHPTEETSRTPRTPTPRVRGVTGGRRLPRPMQWLILRWRLASRLLLGCTPTPSWTSLQACVRGRTCRTVSFVGKAKTRCWLNVVQASLLICFAH